MEYLDTKYKIKGLKKGDLKTIQKNAINESTGKQYSYSHVLKVLIGLRNNETITRCAKKLVKQKQRD